MTCPTCGSPCVAVYTHNQTLGRKRIEWSECAKCIERQDERAQKAIEQAEEAGA